MSYRGLQIELTSRLSAMAFVRKPAPRMPTDVQVFRQQLKLLDQGQRVTSIFVLLVIGMVGLNEVMLNPDHGLFALPNIIPAFMLSMAWAFMVWMDETPNRRKYHWAMPVDPDVHDFMRVLAGAVWLVVAMLAACSTVYAFSAIADGGFGVFLSSPIAWLNFITGGLVMYFLASIIPVVANRPLQTLLVAGACLFLVAGLLDGFTFGLREALMGAWEVQPWSQWELGRAVHAKTFASGDYAAYLLSTVVWLPASIYASWTATQFAPR